MIEVLEREPFCVAAGLIKEAILFQVGYIYLVNFRYQLAHRHVIAELANLLLIVVDPAMMEIRVDPKVFGVDLNVRFTSSSELRVGPINEFQSPPYFLRDDDIVDILNQLRGKYFHEFSFQDVVVDLERLVSDVIGDEIVLVDGARLAVLLEAYLLELRNLNYLLAFSRNDSF